MRRFESKNLQTHHQKIKTGSTQLLSSSEESTLINLLSSQPSKKEGIVKIAKLLFKKYNRDYDSQFRILEKIEDFDTIFENIALQNKKPVFLVYAKKKNFWVLLCLIQTDDESRGLFKDPCGAPIPPKLEKKIKEKISNLEIISHNEDQHVENEESYGEITLRNLKIMLELYEDEDFAKKFQQVRFNRKKKIEENTLVKVAENLALNKEFKTSFKRFIDDLPLELNVERMKYRKVLEEEEAKEESDQNRILEAKNRYLEKAKKFQERIEKYKDDYKTFMKNRRNEHEEYELEIQKKFPDEMKKVASIFQIINKIKDDEEKKKLLKKICEILEVDYERMWNLYEDKSKEDKEKEKKLVLGDIEEIAKNLPSPIKKKNKNEDYTPLSQLLQEIVLGMDGEETPQTELKELEEKFDSVMKKYEEWKNKDITSINTWAKTIRGSLGSSDDVICESIAIMDRAFNLLTTWRLRIPQILSLLIFLTNKNSQGRLCQIQTGEGKTVIVSILAVFKILQGHTVDVITSNEVLATAGVKETKSFYSTFGITVATNNHDDDKVSYTADVLYGTISNFQFDFLRDVVDGVDLRREREFGVVILDEVDSMLVDNGGHIAKIASPYPGMENLRYIYIKIWQELHIAEESFIKETRNKVEEMIGGETEKIKKYLENVLREERKVIKEKIKKSHLKNSLIPPHLEDYVDRKMDIWIRNAVYAKYSCHQHQQYRIVDEDDEEIVTPVDYLNTGVTMKNTIWSEGLHQFVQLKHNLRLTFETLTSSFISNIGYIKKYEDNNIFGMTGTLGSRAEQELLSSIYRVTYAKLPTYKGKKFKELPSVVVEDDEWSKQVALHALEKIDEGRAVLVICETEQDLLDVKSNLEIFGVRMRIYANEEDSDETRDKVKIGEAILATNIAGRGTNFKTEKDLEKNGGLHVCVGFLPYNLRVEGQAFGRTSRQGNKGTAQLIIRRSEVEELEIGENPTFLKIKEERDRLEGKRLKQIDEVLVKEIDFKDELFDLFSKFQKEWKEGRDEIKDTFVLQDLREFWAFWLDRRNFKASNIGKSAREEFEDFRYEARRIISGEIAHNLYYSVGLASHYLEEEEQETGKALTELRNAVGLNGNDIMAGAHLKLFEISVLEGHKFWEKLKKALLDILFIPSTESKPYKEEASEHLNQAKRALTAEISHIEENLIQSPNFLKILSRAEKNFFVEHIYSRLFFLQVHQGNIEELLHVLEEKSGVDFNGRVATSLKTLKEVANEKVTVFELNELHLIGLDVIYSLREVKDVPDYVIKAAQGQILGGIATLVMGFLFPPIYLVTQTIAITLISEGVIDIVAALVSEDFDVKEFLKEKFVSYAVDALTFGISSILRCVKVVKLAIRFFRKMSTFLRNSRFLKSFCLKVANRIDDVVRSLTLTLELSDFRKLTKVQQLKELQRLKETNREKFHRFGGLKKLTLLENLTSLGKIQDKQKLLGVFLTTLSINFGKKLTGTLTEKLLFEPLFDLAFEKLAQKLKESLKTSAKNNPSLRDKIRTTSPEKIQEVTKNFVGTDEFAQTSSKLVTALVRKLDITLFDALVFLYAIIKDSGRFATLYTSFVRYFDEHLQGGTLDNDVDEILDDVCSGIVETLLSSIYDMLKEGFIFGKNIFKRKINQESISEENGESEENEENGGNAKKELLEYYETLGIDPKATLEDVKRQYRIVLMKVHYDQNASDSEDFQKVVTAYEKIQQSFQD